MARCPECNKFVPYDDSTEPEVDNLDVTADPGAITATVRIVLTCAECRTELRETTFDVEVDCEAFASAHRGEGCELTVDTASIEATSRMQTVDARGHKVSARYAKTFYGFLAEFEVSCGCGSSASFRVDDEVQASFMEELV